MRGGRGERSWATWTTTAATSCSSSTAMCRASAIGAEVTVEFGAERQLQIVHGGVGFASQNDRRLHFGLGRTGRADRVTIRWPSGTVQTIEHPAVDQLYVVTEPRPDA